VVYLDEPVVGVLDDVLQLDVGGEDQLEPGGGEQAVPVQLLTPLHQLHAPAHIQVMWFMTLMKSNLLIKYNIN